jgi:hypothetical protein
MAMTNIVVSTVYSAIRLGIYSGFLNTALSQLENILLVETDSRVAHLGRLCRKPELNLATQTGVGFCSKFALRRSAAIGGT